MADPDLLEREESVDHLEKLVDLANLAHEDPLVNREHRDLEENLVYQEPMDELDLQGLKVKVDSVVNREREVGLEKLVDLGNQAGKVKVDREALLDQQVHREKLDLQEKLGQLDLLDLLVGLVREVSLVRLVNLEKVAQLDPQALLDLLEREARGEKLVVQERVDRLDLLEEMVQIVIHSVFQSNTCLSLPD